MKTPGINKLFSMLALVLALLACTVSSPKTATEAPVTEVADSPTQEQVAAPDATQSAPPTEVPSIQHQVFPVDLPVERSSHAGDYDSSTTAANKTSAGGDRFTFERFERPFNANTMDVYFSQLDIVDTLVFQDDTWIYSTITLKGVDASNALSGKYAAELDTNLDGKGDWIIIVSSPSTTDWSVTGVSIYQDANHDVGNELPMLTDEGQPGGDGFETLVFDQGQGHDPDSAWARISSTTPNTVEIAVKRAVLGDTNKYLINMWAGSSLLDPALFDISDHFTHEQAGAADAALQFYYPIKQVFELDNSCRMAVGFEPTGKEAGLCEVLTTEDSCTPSPQQLRVCEALGLTPCPCN